MSEGIHELDTVILRRDDPTSGLRAGDVGTVVFVYDGAYEVEFLAASGRTDAVLTLDASDVSPVVGGDPSDRTSARGGAR